MTTSETINAIKQREINDYADYTSLLNKVIKGVVIDVDNLNNIRVKLGKSAERMAKDIELLIRVNSYLNERQEYEQLIKDRNHIQGAYREWKQQTDDEYGKCNMGTSKGRQQAQDIEAKAKTKALEYRNELERIDRRISMINSHSIQSSYLWDHLRIGGELEMPAKGGQQ